MIPHVRRFGWVVLLAVAGLLTVEMRQSRAQTLNDGWKTLENKYRGSAYRRIGEFWKGAKVDPNDPSHVEAIDLQAKIYTYGVYLRKLETQPGEINKDFEAFVHDVDTHVLKAKDREAVQPLAEALRDKVRVHALEVIQFPNALPIHKIHNARVLHKIAELGQPELADTLLTVLKDDKQNDGVRYYALKGLATLLAKVQPPEATPVLNKDQQAKCAEALVEFLEQKKGPDKKAAADEIDGFRLLRREAIRALAKIHVPSANKVRPALVLARFAGNDKRIAPPPRIDERMEAAIGLARMQSAQDKQYQPDYAAGQIAKFLGAFAQMAVNERKTLKNLEFQTRPWKTDAALLMDALAALQSDSGKNAYVSKIAERGRTKLLDGLIKGKDLQNEVPWWLSEESDPPSKELFQGLADSTVQPAPPGEVTEK